MCVCGGLAVRHGHPDNDDDSRNHCRNHPAPPRTASMTDQITQAFPTWTAGRDALARFDANLEHRRYRTDSGATIEWRIAGSGKPLVLVHGGHGNWSHWIRNIDYLAATRTVFLPDLPGYGDSDGPPRGGSFADLIDATLESLDGLIGPATSIDLAGFSFGGLVAATLACRRPVGQIMLVGSAGHGGKRRPQSPLLNWKKAESADERRALLDANLKAFMLHSADSADPLACAAYQDACLKTRFRSKDISLASPLMALLRDANIAPLLLWGDCDVTAAEPAKFSHALRVARIPHDFHLVPRAGHWAQYEAADEVNRRLGEFLLNG
jgi:pimeloyl-ACP methyl ester carboxylesterase